MSDEPKSDSAPSPREDFAAHNIRWAFHKDVPVSAIPYFIKRAQSDDLRWPITHMPHGIDHPDAVEFVARQLAEIEQSIEGKGRFSPYTNMAPDEWRRRQEEKGRPMSRPSRDRLLALWQNRHNEKHLRRQSFRLWAETDMDGDLEILRSIDASDLLADKVLRERVARADRTAVPGLLAKLQGNWCAPWWRLARHVWSQPLSLAMDQELERRRALPAAKWSAFSDMDSAFAELITDFPSTEAEPFLINHWDHLQFSPLFVQAALFQATPRLLAMAKAAIEAAPEPKKMFAHITMHYGIYVHGRQGFTRRSQIEALFPYLGYLDALTIHEFWRVCNERGWLDIRRQYFDGRLDDRFKRAHTDEARSMASLDQLAANNNVHWIDRWIEDYFEAGATLDQIMSPVGKWLASRKTVNAMRVAAAALVHAGRRSDINLLDVNIEPHDFAAAIRADTEFAVRRRTLI